MRCHLPVKIFVVSILISGNQPFPRRSFPYGLINHRAFSVEIAKCGQGAPPPPPHPHLRCGNGERRLQPQGAIAAARGGGCGRGGAGRRAERRGGAVACMQPSSEQGFLVPQLAWRYPWWTGPCIKTCFADCKASISTLLWNRGRTERTATGATRPDSHAASSAGAQLLEPTISHAPRRPRPFILIAVLGLPHCFHVCGYTA